MNKKQQIRAYKSELREIETQEALFKQTINTITRRKIVLLEALDELGASGAPSGTNKKSPLTEKQILELKASLMKKAPRQRGLKI